MSFIAAGFVPLLALLVGIVLEGLDGRTRHETLHEYPLTFDAW